MKKLLPGGVIKNPPSYWLQEIDRSWRRLMCELIGESGPLQSSVRRHVEGIGLTEEPLQLESVEVDLSR
jgi:hypothetical protein